MRTGTTICGRYRLEHRLGSGGQASVWRCRDLVTGRDVAVKVVDFEEDPRKARRATREIQTLQRLTDPHTVRILDTGRDDDDHYVYIVMPIITGESLSDRLLRGHMDVPDVVSIIQGVSSSLSEAHSLGVCHRDVKPSNIMIHASGAAVLLDFGIASSLDQSSSLTATGTVIGTLPYMAPEVVRGQKASPASDIYALGAVMYECISGRPPFVAEDLLTSLAAIHASITRQTSEHARIEAAIAVDGIALGAVAGRAEDGVVVEPEPGVGLAEDSAGAVAERAENGDGASGRLPERRRRSRRARRGSRKDGLMAVLAGYSFITCLLLPLALVIPLIIGRIDKSIAMVLLYVWYSSGLLAFFAQAPLFSYLDRIGKRHPLRSSIGVALNWFACNMLSYFASSRLLLFASRRFDLPRSLHRGLGLPDSFHDILAINIGSSGILWSAASVIALIVFLVIIAVTWVRRRDRAR